MNNTAEFTAEHKDTYRLRVQEVGSSYYLIFSNCTLRIIGDWLILLEGGHVRGVFNRDKIIYVQDKANIQASQG